MGHAILWFDNDLDYLEPYAAVLREAGYSLTTVGRLRDADRELGSKRYDLLILDVMIPTQSEDEELRYPPEATNRCNDTGLLYYQTWREKLAKAGTAVLILTVRPDARIREMFKQAGAPTSAVSTKYNLREVDDFMKKVEQVLAARALK
jgi:CheY-like chemotaxis protein